MRTIIQIVGCIFIGALIGISIFTFQGCLGSGGIGNSESSSQTIDDDSDNSINGVEECIFQCTPVDSDLCNDSDLTNNVCFQVNFHCRGSGAITQPEFTSTPPDEAGCVQQSDIFEEEESPTATPQPTPTIFSGFS